MNRSDLSRNQYMLHGPLAKNGYDWWWHSFTGMNRITKEEKTFFVEYFIINPGRGKDAPVFGQLDHTQKPSYVMIKAGTWGKDARQIHCFYPIRDLYLNPIHLDLSIGEQMLTENFMKGSVAMSEQDVKEHPEYMCDSGSMQWKIKIHKKVAFHVGYGASKFFRCLNAFDMFWHAEGMKTEYEGIVIYNGEEYDVLPESSYGYADKNWGRDFTSPWVWISSNHLTSKKTGKVLKNSVFDIGGGCPKVFGIPLPRKLLIDFYYEGKDYEFNFSKFWTKTKTKFNCYETDTQIVWKVQTQNRTAAMDLICTCQKEDMLLINYEAPNGQKLHNQLWNGGTGVGMIKLYDLDSEGNRTLIDTLHFDHAGCEYGEYDKKAKKSWFLDLLEDLSNS